MKNNKPIVVMGVTLSPEQMKACEPVILLKKKRAHFMSQEQFTMECLKAMRAARCPLKVGNTEIVSSS